MNTRRTVFSLLSAALVASTGALLHCSSSDDHASGASATAIAGRYRGTLAGEGDLAGTIDLTIQDSTGLAPQHEGEGHAQVSGTLTVNVPGVGPVTLTGEVDTATGSITFAGTAQNLPVTFTGSLANGVLSGTFTSPWGTGSFSATSEQLGGLKVYCGTFDGSLAGRWNLFTAAGRAGGVFAATTGQQGVLVGTATDTSVTLTVPPSGQANGTVASGAVEGTWSNGAGQSGAFRVSESGCAALPPRSTTAGSDAGTDAGTNGGTDGGTDGGGPVGTVENVYTVPGATNVSYLTLAGDTLYYGLDYTYFSEKNSISKVKTNGTGAAEIVPVNDPKVTKKAPLGGLTNASNKLYYLAGTDPPGGDANLFSVGFDGTELTNHGSTGQAGPNELGAANLLTTNGTKIYRASCQVSSGMFLKGYDLAGAASGTVSDLLAPCGIVAEANDVYYASFVGIFKVPSSLVGTPVEIAKDSTYQLAGFTPAIAGAAADATHLYFVGSNNAGKTGAIWRRAKDGSGTTTQLATFNGLARGVAVDKTYAYFVVLTSGGGQQQGGVTTTLHRIAKTASGGTPEVVAPANAFPVVMDATHLYFGQGTSIKKVARF